LPTTVPIKLEFPEELDFKLQIFIKVLQGHPATCNRVKVQKISNTWKGFSLDGLSPEEITSILTEYQKRLLAFEIGLAAWRYPETTDNILPLAL